jgi:hypothetical protein
VDFIDVTNPEALANKMLAFQNNRHSFKRARASDPEQPFASDWRELLALLIAGLG